MMELKKITKETLLNIVLITEDEDEWFTPECESLLKEIFETFDLDKDGYWNEKEMDSYFSKTNGKKLSSDDYKEIIESFDVNAKNELSLRGFYELYHLQTLNYKDETINDFLKIYDEKTLYEKLQPKKKHFKIKGFSKKYLSKRGYGRLVSKDSDIEACIEKLDSAKKDSKILNTTFHIRNYVVSIQCWNIKKTSC